jgi:hypothetical protein
MFLSNLVNLSSSQEKGGLISAPYRPILFYFFSVNSNASDCKQHHHEVFLPLITSDIALACFWNAC